MSTLSRYTRQATSTVLPTLLAATVTSLLSLGSAHAATARNATAVAAAHKQSARASQLLAANRRALTSCRRSHPRRCANQQRAVKHAAGEVASAQRKVARLGASKAVAHIATAVPAPTLTVSSTTLKWSVVRNLTSYVFVRKVPGSADQYSIINGTSTTPPAAPGKTVHFSVRANVSNSTWAPEVAITYPSSTSPSPTPPVSGALQTGVVAGSALSYELQFIQPLGAHTSRMEFDISTPASQIAPIVGAYAAAGIRPMLLASFNSRVPTTAEAQNLGTWAAQLGPGGSYWKGKNVPADTAVTDIEFGNETSYSYQFSDNSSSTYAARAQTYALRFRDAQIAVQAANPTVGLLAIGDNAQQGTSWVTNMFKAVPDLGSRVAGWTIHPYGPNWASRIDSTVSSTAAAGAPSAIPIWVTEYGISTDNGRCLSDNYGWNPCMTYSDAASTLGSVLTGMVSRYGGRLGGFFVYEAHDWYASGTHTGREDYFGAGQSNGAPKGALTTEVKALLAAGH